MKAERDRLAKQADMDLAEIEKLRADLKAQEAEYAAQVETLSARYAESETRVAKLEKEIEKIDDVAPVEVASVGPASIELIEPPVTLTRGAYVATIPESMEKREIIGKIAAPAGLIRFNVNDQPVETDSEGLFTHWVPVSGGRTPVSMSVVDRQGQRVAIEFDLVRRIDEKKKEKKVSKATQPKRVKGLGKYHALVVGNSNYSDFPTLRTPANDAKMVAELLEKKYGFKTRLMLDATRYDILLALNEYRKELTKNDNLLVYYAGHGEIDQVNSQGYWLPVDAEKDNTAN